MTAKILMVQGTASHVGKSVLVAALCRIFRQDGFRVAPFKAQNMSNNSYVTASGGEIGRAQAMQAEAAGVEATVEMNPVLLKPEADYRSQIVVLGRRQGSAGAAYFSSPNPELWQVVIRSLDALREQYDVVVIEGAGSPAEINLKATEMVNMRVARYADAPVLLVGDIDRGGVFASLVGTLELLEPEERRHIGAFVINKFRGDLSLLEPGLRFLEERTGVPVAGVVPYFKDIHIPEEDAVALDERLRMKGQAGYLLDIAVMGFPHISNFDDFDPLKREEGVRLRYVEGDDSLGEPDLIILPGTKTTLADLEWLRGMGYDQEIQALSHKGTAVMGICGGYQMLGERISDPEGVESPREEGEGLGLLPVTTVFTAVKETHQIKGSVCSDAGILSGACGLPLEGYEIHMGRTFPSGEDTGPPKPDSPENGKGQPVKVTPPFFIHERPGRPCDAPDGATDPDGRVIGTNIHGLFHNRDLGRAILNNLALWKGVELPGGAAFTGQGDTQSRDGEYDKLARLVRESLDMDLVYRLAGLELPGP